MPATLLAALFFTVALLVTTTYFLLGSIPLLVLKHDTPMDSRFVRTFFSLYYRAALFCASAAAVSYAFAGQRVIAAGAVGLALLAVLLRRKVIPQMETLGVQIATSGTDAIRGFRRTHVLAILVNLAQLALIVGSLVVVSMQNR